MKTFKDYTEGRRIFRISDIPPGTLQEPTPAAEDPVPLPYGYSSDRGSTTAPKIPAAKPDAMKNYLQLIKLKKILRTTQAQIAELEARMGG